MIRSLTRVSRSRVRDSFLFFGFSEPCFFCVFGCFSFRATEARTLCRILGDLDRDILLGHYSTEGSGIVGSSRRGLWKTVLAAYRFLSHATITSVFFVVEIFRYHFAFSLTRVCVWPRTRGKNFSLTRRTPLPLDAP